MRLIDADALLDAISVHLERIEQEFDDAPTIDAVPATLADTLCYLHEVGWMQEHDRIMTEDAVQVVRCKDCKYYDTPKNFKKPYCMRGAYAKVNADDYCSKGERK